MEELKPCPFCGHLDEPHDDDCFVVLYEKWIKSGYSSELRESVEDAWNRRADECDRDELLSVCAEIEDADVDGFIDWAERIRKAIGEE